ncbi:FadR/GntR family transcriptional regulator [Hoeflea sp. YIM 152468]|uniref:FadR/GntR family transcriptional regulator n=1 Tax=Hoeflea sp. YIM 152468 TaxID=3031759 RepID=UPI0023DBD533|nr:FadR/GntR family transcriptional regulator [Hoeflea sp. YIM 152468]MDF1608419.1 FadR/GntR family transcriptional regulator [Hoeflea sp. YIM 152468]
MTGIIPTNETDSQSGSERVFAYFRSRILSGELRTGDRLPSERDLATQLNVGRPLLRETMRALGMLGLIDIRHGSGAFVGKADISVLANFFTFSLAQEQNASEDIMQARMAIECQAIRLACERATDSDLDRIGGCLTALIQTLSDPEKGGLADFRFHAAIVQASHSQALITLYKAISELLMQNHVERRRVTHNTPKVIDDLVESHRQVFLSIVEGDGDAADHRLRDHFAIGDELRRKSIIAAFSGGGVAK